MLTVVKFYAYLYIFVIFMLRIISADVLILTDANFTDKIRNYEMAVVKFYVPW